MIRVPRVVLAAPASGSGKTTAAMALMRRLADRGLRVAPFKIGPDYIDPSHHQAAAGRASRNLDGWMLPHDTVRALFDRATRGERDADVAVLEGVMGLFDGRSASSEAGSTAEMAKVLGAPVVLVLDAGAMARTAAAIVHGMATFDAGLGLAGVILNRVAGVRHFELCRDAIVDRTGVPVLGWIPRDPAFAVPERNLGLVLAGEHLVDLAHLAERTADTLDVDGLLAIARSAPPHPLGANPFPAPIGEIRAAIAVARDAAFDFYYEDNLDLLRDLGAELRFFSPLGDAGLPDADALYLGGGYPELHAAELAANASMRAGVRRFAEAGHPVYGECGGLMYLGESLTDRAGVCHPMTRVLPVRSRMQDRGVLGYREAEARVDSPIACRGWTVRGHEFHYSVLESPPADPAYRRADGDETEGLVGGPTGNVLGSYIHVHFGADPRLAARFVEQAARHRNSRPAAPQNPNMAEAAGLAGTR